MQREIYQQRIDAALTGLGIDAEQLARRGIPLYAEAQELEIAEVGRNGRRFLLISAAAKGWRLMKKAAAEEGHALYLVSAYRSVERQRELIQAKLDRGEKIEAILEVLAAPGYSEHHTGRAVDLLTPGCPPLNEAFDQTPAFQWLAGNAQRHGFYLTYPRNNRFGYCYEPWHWCYRDD